MKFRLWFACGLLLFAGSVVSVPRAQQAQAPVFRSSLNLVLVDVIARDRAGQLVRNLTARDFEVREDGRPQEIRSVAFQTVDEAVPPIESVPLLASLAEGAPAPATTPTPSTARKPAQDISGRRLMVLLFDVSSIPAEDLDRTVESARKYVADQMTPADLVAVASIGSRLDLLADFTGDKTKIADALDRLTAGEVPAADAAAAASADPGAAGGIELSELTVFNNDLRLRALRTLASTLAPIEQKKAIVYFSAGMEGRGADNAVELRAAINAAIRSNIAIYSVDTAGLKAIVPGGDASRPSSFGVSALSGRGVLQQFTQAAAASETLITLSADTGGRSFTNSNNFGEAFARVQRDMSGYYILGYVSTNKERDGRFRRIDVRIKGQDSVRIEARNGYYADRDFARSTASDRRQDLEQQLAADISPTDLPVILSSGYFRLAADRYYVPVAIAVPGSAVPVAPGREKGSLDILGIVRDERGRSVGRIQQTMDLPTGTAATLAGKQVLYQAGLTLPPGRFSIKVVVRENTTGQTGSFEAPIAIPDLVSVPLKVSSVILSTQLQPTRSASRDNPLVRDGVQLLPNLTHVVGRQQSLYLYYEVYDAAPRGVTTTRLRTNLAFYHDDVKLFETPAVERSRIDAPDRQAALFQFEVPASRFQPGLYTCQVNIIDDASGQFAFPRVQLLVR